LRVYVALVEQLRETLSHFLRGGLVRAAQQRNEFICAKPPDRVALGQQVGESRQRMTPYA
jgi:hypothetical protein